MQLLGFLSILMLPACGGLLNTLIDKNDNKKRYRLAIATAVLNFLIVIAMGMTSLGDSIHLLEINAYLDLYVKMDGLGLLFATLAGFLWILTTLYSIGYLAHDDGKKKFFTFFLITLSVVNGIAIAGNLITLYLFYEVLTLVTFPLVIHYGSEEALLSGKKYLIYSFLGATFVLLGMIILFSITSSVDFTVGGLDYQAYGDINVIHLSYLMLFIGFGVKAALVPFHSWLPSAMVAPTPVSALLHAVAVVKSGIFALIRISYYIFGFEVLRNSNVRGGLALLVFFTIVMGSLLALHQNHLKKRLAYSTISQLGYIMLGILFMNNVSLTAALIHMVNHGIIKITLFFCVGIIYERTHKVNVEDIRGLGRKMPVTMIAFTIAAISLIGIPPTNGFVSKWYLAIGALSEGNVLFVIILLLSALLTAGYLLPLVIMAFFDGEKKTGENFDPSWEMKVPIIVLSVAICFMGLFPNFLVKYIDMFIVQVVGM